MTKAELQLFHDVNDKCQELIRENKALKKRLHDVSKSNDACQSLSRRLLQILRTRGGSHA